MNNIKRSKSAVFPKEMVIKSAIFTRKNSKSQNEQSFCQNMRFRFPSSNKGVLDVKERTSFGDIPPPKQFSPVSRTQITIKVNGRAGGDVY